MANPIEHLTMNIIHFKQKPRFSRDYFRFHLGYDFDDNEFRWDQAKYVEGADTESYEILNHYWAKDKNFIYQQGQRLGLPDFDSFTVLNECYAKDKNKIYTLGGTFEGVKDIESFVVCDSGYHPETAPETRNLPTESDEEHEWDELYDERTLVHGGYAKDDSNGYFFSNLIDFEHDEDDIVHLNLKQFQIIENIDPETFRTLEKGFAIDKNRAYYLGLALDGSDPKSFAIMEIAPVEYAYLIDIHLSKDANNVYFLNDKFEDADPDSFDKIDSEYNQWFKDNSHVYFNNIKLPKVDASSFKLISPSFAIDRSHAYYENRIIPNVDIYSFQSFGNSCFARDKHKLYSEDTVIHNLIHGALRGLTNFAGDQEYFKDNKNIYYISDEFIIVDADYESFELFAKDYDQPEARDKDHFYSFGHIHEDQDSVLALQPEPGFHSFLEEANMGIMENAIKELQAEIELLAKLPYEKDIVEQYTALLKLEANVQQKLSRYSFEDYEKLIEKLSGDDELEKQRVKNDMQEFRNYSKMMDKYFDRDFDELLLDSNYINEADDELNNTLEEQHQNEARIIRTWWSDTKDSTRLKSDLLSCLDILTQNNKKIIQDAHDLLFNTNRFYENYKHEHDYVDVLTFSNICKEIFDKNYFNPLDVIIEYMLIPDKYLFFIGEVYYAHELKPIFEGIKQQLNIEIDLSILDDGELLESEYQNSVNYLLDILARNLENTGNRLFSFAGKSLGLLPSNEYISLARYSSKEIDIRDYFTLHPMRKGLTALKDSIQDDIKMNKDLIAQIENHKTTH